MTIRSHVLTAALAGLLALAPAATAGATAATTPPSSTHLEPRNRAAAQRIRVGRAATDILNAAATTVRTRVRGCDIKPGFDGTHTTTHDAPSPDFVNAIAALRRPATPAELAPAGGVEAILPGRPTPTTAATSPPPTATR